MPTASAAGASRCTPGWARTTCSRWVLPRPIRTTSFRSIAVRSSIPALGGALDAAWAIAEPLTPTGKPLDIQITATDSGLDVDVRGSGPLPATMIATLSRRRRAASPGAADAPWRTGADAHAADDRDRHGTGHPAAGFVPAGHRRRRGSAGGAGDRSIASAPSISPTCFAGSGRLRCGWRQSRGFRHSTATPAR